MKLSWADSRVSVLGVMTVPKLQGLLNQPLVEAEFSPEVVSVGVLVRVVAPARRAGNVVPSGQLPAGRIFLSDAVETTCRPVPEGNTNGPGVVPRMLATSVL